MMGTGAYRKTCAAMKGYDRKRFRRKSGKSELGRVTVLFLFIPIAVRFRTNR